MLTLQHVTKSYTRRSETIAALRDAMLEIPAGDFVAVTGPSGSGKSTLLQMLGGMMAPTTGTILFDGRSLYEMTPNERATLRVKRIGFVFQTFNLVPYLTAAENVQVPLLLAGVPPKEQRERAAELLDRVGLADRFEHRPSELSVGQQQRVALARMLANDPAVILADEPTGNLDPETANEVFGFLEAANSEGRTVVLVTHDPRLAKRAKRTLRIEGGQLVGVDLAESVAA